MSHPAAYVDWTCPGCGAVYVVDPLFIHDELTCPDCREEEEEEDDDDREECAEDRAIEHAEGLRKQMREEPE